MALYSIQVAYVECVNCELSEMLERCDADALAAQGALEADRAALSRHAAALQADVRIGCCQRALEHLWCPSCLRVVLSARLAGWSCCVPADMPNLLMFLGPTTANCFAHPYPGRVAAGARRLAACRA